MTLEEELLDALNSKDKEKLEKVFESIYNTYHGLIYFCIGKYLSLPEDIEEVLDDVFLSFFNNLNKIEVKSIKYYLVVSASNASLDFIKKNKRHMNVELCEDIAFKDEQTFDNNMFYHQLKKILNTDELYILQEYVLNDKTANEIAKELKTTEGNVRIKYHRIVKKIKQIYGGKI